MSSTNTGVFTSGTAVTNSAYASKFTSDNSSCIVAVNGVQLELKSVTPEAPPVATFTATGADSGTLTNVTSGMKYSLDGGSSWVDISAAPTTIAGGITTANGIQVVKRGNGTTTGDSAAQIITVTQATAPTGIGKTDADASGKGTITGVNTNTEYKLSTASTYTVITSTTVTGLVPGTYVSVK